MHASPKGMGTEGVAQARVGDAGAGTGSLACGRAKQYPPPTTEGPAAVSGPVVVVVVSAAAAAAAAADDDDGVWWARGIGWGVGQRGYGHTAGVAAEVAAPFGGMWLAGGRG